MAESGTDLERHELWELDRHHSIEDRCLAPAGARNCLLLAHVRQVRGFLRLGGVRAELVGDRGLGGVRSLRRFQCNVLHSPRVTRVFIEESDQSGEFAPEVAHSPIVPMMISET